MDNNLFFKNELIAKKRYVLENWLASQIIFNSSV